MKYYIRLGLLLLMWAGETISSSAATLDNKELAKRTARQTWWYFSKRVEEPQKGQKNFTACIIKGNDIVEYSSLAVKNSNVYALAANNATGKTDSILLDTSAVADWFFYEGNTLVGGFYQREILYGGAFKTRFHYSAADPAITDDFIKATKVKPYESGVKKDSLTPQDHKYIMHLVNNIRYPEYAKGLNLQGTVYARVMLDKDGKVTSLEIIRGIGGGCNEETLRVLKTAPFPKPKLSGVPVRYVAPVTYVLR